MAFRGFTSFVAGLLIAIGLGASAQAADELAQDTFEARWTGFYVGLVGGYHAGNINFANCTGFCPTNPKFNSWGVGIQAGYDYQFANNVVLGGYVNVPFAASRSTFNIGLPGFNFTVRSKFAAHVGARLGYDVNGFLPYVAAGYSMANVEASSFFNVTRSSTHHGYHLAVGLEKLWTENFSTDLRYTYSSLGRRTYNFGGGASNWGENASNFTAAINYRF